jgi:hypothetical protein
MAKPASECTEPTFVFDPETTVIIAHDLSSGHLDPAFNAGQLAMAEALRDFVDNMKSNVAVGVIQIGSRDNPDWPIEVVHYPEQILSQDDRDSIKADIEAVPVEDGNWTYPNMEDIETTVLPMVESLFAMYSNMGNKVLIILAYDSLYTPTEEILGGIEDLIDDSVTAHTIGHYINSKAYPGTYYGLYTFEMTGGNYYFNFEGSGIGTSLNAIGAAENLFEE